MAAFRITSTTTRAVGAAAVALLVVGAGAAIGMGTSAGGNHGSVVREASPTTGAGPTSTTPVGSSTTAASTTTTTTGSRGVAVASPSTRPSTAAAGQTGGASSTGPSAGVGSATTAPVGHDQVSVGRLRGTPAPGTYTYDTSGQSTLFSNTTPYPSKTTIEVTRQGCGVSAKWNSSPGNSTTVYECPVTGGIHVVSETSTVDAGGYHNTMSFDCDANSFVPTSGTPGQTWTWACHSSNGETTTQVVKLVGPETMTVAGAAVATEHVHIVSTLSGPQKGTVTTDYWLTPDATPVHEVGSIDASQFGVTYKSDYTLQLESLTPSA